jgi:Zn-dependent protease with chaperone function
MIDDDVRALERKVFLSKLQFAIFFAVITLINFLPYFLVCLFRGIVSGMTLLVISLFILAATVLLLFWLGKRALMRLIGATPISQEKYREILGLSEDISLATGKPIPELMIRHAAIYSQYTLEAEVSSL